MLPIGNFLRQREGDFVSIWNTGRGPTEVASALPLCLNLATRPAGTTSRVIEALARVVA
jgi:hypothetical protein